MGKKDRAAVMGPKPMFTAAECLAIASEYDGMTETIDELVRKYKVKRHNIAFAARRGGYKTKRSKIEWTPERDAYLVEQWGKIPPAQVYAYLGCSPASVFNRLKRIGHSTRDNPDFTVYDVEHLTKIDHRQWRGWIERGWLKAYQEYGCNGETWSRRIKLEWLHAFFREHPEAFNYRAADKYARGVLELSKLPDPPAFMRITCRSDAWRDGERLTPFGSKYHHGELVLKKMQHHFSLNSCAKDGGTEFWAPLYATPSCPRCGCKASRFSEKALFTDKDPGDAESLNAIAGKLGLVWRRGLFYTPKGERVTEEELLRFVFSTKRNAGKAFTTFRRLLQAGITVTSPNPVTSTRILPNILDFQLREGAQRAAWQAFLRNGNVGIYWPPGIGKMYFLGTVFTRIAGEHFLFVHTNTMREQWIAFFKAHAPRVKVTGFYSATSIGRTQPYHRVDIFDHAGELRSTLRIYGYQTRAKFDHERPGVAGFDEAQFLPGNGASRLSMISSEYRVGLSATPFREDGRADLIQIMTGEALGEDWKPFKDSGEIPDVPIRVLLVKDIEHKHQALGRTLKGHRTIVFSDAIADGQRIEAELGIPFIHGGVKNRLQVLGQHKAVCMSRVGDCGIDVPDLKEVIEFNFHHGSRAQSLQRLGRLLHSRWPLRHTVMMTRKEFSLYHKRLSALEAKGYKISIQVWTGRIRRGRPPAMPVRSWVQALGIRPAPVARGINKVTGKPYETNAEKRDRVQQRLEQRTGVLDRKAA